jgi:kynurenine formamidase
MEGTGRRGGSLSTAGRLIDLTATLGGADIPVSPQLAQVMRIVREPVNTHERHGRSNTRITLLTHSGTHVDCPYHYFADGQTIDQVPLERCAGPGARADLRDVARANLPITPELVAARVPPGLTLQDLILILHTGWLERTGGDARYFLENPHLTPELARWLVAQRVKAIAVDTQVEHAPAARPPDPSDSPVHRILLGAGILIIEHLINLDQLPASGFELFAFPIKLHRADGAPARVVAILEG